MNDLFIVSHVEQFNTLLKNRAEEFPNLIKTTRTFKGFPKNGLELFATWPSAIIFLDGSTINVEGGVEHILKLAVTNPIVIIKNLYTPPEVYRYLKAGVKGLTSLENCYNNFINICNAVSNDEVYLSSREVGHLFHHVKSTLDTSELTDREQEILPLIMNGSTYSEVAELLDISYETIKSHMKNIYKKLNVRTKGDLLRYDFSN